MNSSYKLSVVSLNNEGIIMITNGRYEQAVHTFAAALRCLAIEEESCYQHQCPPSLCDRTVYCVHDHHNVLSVPIYPSSLRTSNRVDATEEEGINVFQLPILVVDENDVPCDADHHERRASPSSRRGRTRSFKRGNRILGSSTRTRLDFVILFNLALSYHFLGLQKDDSTISAAPILHNAVSFYEMAYRMLMEENEVPVARAMVILSNLGQIYRHLNNEASATACFQRLLSTMLVLHHQGDASRIEHWESFVSNVSGLMTSRSHFACFPAAAA